MLRLWIMVLCLSSLSCWASENNLKSFSTDFCTAYPEGTVIHPQLWRHCCIEHDLFLWAGGSAKDRVQVDKGLLACVQKTGAVVNASLIYWGVRLGNLSPIKFEDKKWGNGWIKPRLPEALSYDEIDMIERHLQSHPSIHLSEEAVSLFVDKLRQRIP